MRINGEHIKAKSDKENKILTFPSFLSSKCFLYSLREVTASSVESCVIPWIRVFRKCQARNFKDTHLKVCMV